MTRHQKRNIVGDIATFFLALLINLLALVAVVIVEGKQSDWGKKFAFEWDDVLRRGSITIFGSVLQGLLIYSIVW